MIDKITVDAQALRELLQALVGPEHLIRELQTIRDIQGDDSPINKLLSDYNGAVSEGNNNANN